VTHVTTSLWEIQLRYALQELSTNLLQVNHLSLAPRLILIFSFQTEPGFALTISPIENLFTFVKPNRSFFSYYSPTARQINLPNGSCAPLAGA
jgi:hypothetical protein